MSNDGLRGTLVIITGAGGVEESLQLEQDYGGEVINSENGGILTTEGTN